MVERTFRYAEIADALREAVLKGTYESAHVLPSEADLSEQYGASRVTIRKALERLRSEGLVDSRQGFGWFVGADPVRQSLDTLDTIERQLAASGISSERRVLSFGFVSAPPEVAKLLGESQVLQVVRINLADDEPFALVTVWCGEVAGAGLSRNDVETSTFHDLFRGKLGSASQTIGAIAAADAAAATLDIAVGSPLLRVRRVTETSEGENLLVSEHLYPAHRTEFHVTMAHADDGISPTGLRLVDTVLEG